MDLIINDYIVTALSAWGIAQVLKVIINAVVYKKYDLKRLLGDGGMPSAHSATVSSLACISFLINGISSFEFAVSTILAIIVCHDAMGVRKETEKQAIILNEIMKESDIPFSDKVKEFELKEMVGHSALEVFAGVMLGILVAVFVYHIAN